MGIVAAPAENRPCKTCFIYLNAAYMKTITVDSVLEFCPLSRSHFHVLFKQMTGKTFLEYLTDIRLEKAKDQLLGTDTPVADIASMVGFATSSYFGQLFRSATGRSPKRYRDRYARKSGAKTPNRGKPATQPLQRHSRTMRTSLE